MIRRLSLVVFLTLSLLPAPGLALSCMVPNIGETYNRVAEAPEVYLLAEGRFVANGRLPRIPEPAEIQDKQPEIIGSMRFTGRHLGIQADGPLDVDVQVQVACAGPWCGRFPPQNARMVVFLKRDTNGALSLTTSPCPGETKLNPDEDELRALRSCMENGLCGEREIAVFGPGNPRVAQ